jgi:hypothetical protein
MFGTAGCTHLGPRSSAVARFEYNMADHLRATAGGVRAGYSAREFFVE